MAPVTWGVAIEVPVFAAKPPPGTDEVMLVPGASRSTTAALSEEAFTASALVVLPTVTAVVMQPGAPTPVLEPPLPDATTVAMPAARSWSMSPLRESASQVAALPPPRLMLTAAKV